MAAGKTFDSLFCYGKGQVYIGGSFAPNGAGAVDQTTIKGSIVQSVAFVSTGLWLVTLKIGVKDIVWMHADAQIGSAGTVPTNLQIGVVTNTPGQPLTFQVRNNPAGSVANLGPNAGDRINFSMMAQIGAVK